MEDTGIGMSEEFQRKIFEPFEQEVQESGKVFEGTGLGFSSPVYAAHSRLFLAISSGSSTVNRLPLSRSLSTQIFPPISWTRFLVIVIPSPVPSNTFPLS